MNCSIKKYEAFLREKVLQFWYRPSKWAYFLLPAAFIFQSLSLVRRFWYLHIKKTVSFSVPIIVVGNITLGGTGKTPLVAFLVHYFKEKGYSPGIIMRGYKSKLSDVVSVTEQSNVTAVGDEAYLLANKCKNIPVVISRYRNQAVRHLLKNHPQVNLILSDDGLQHYALSRDVEIVVMDGQRRLGNGHCLPAGPLRESAKRLQKVDFIVTHGEARFPEHQMNSRLNETVFAISEKNKKLPLDFFKNKTVHAVAGIGNPFRFFNMLEEAGLKIIPHVFADHHDYSESDLHFAEDFPIIMTEKDAVKCALLPLPQAWYVSLEVKLSASFTDALLRKIEWIKNS